MTHDTYRPPAFDQATGAFDAKGKLIAWKLHLIGPSITARMFPAVVEKNVDPFAIEAAANYPYDVPNVHVDYPAARDRHRRGLLALGEPRAQLLRRRELHGRARRVRSARIRSSSAWRCWKSSRAICERAQARGPRGALRLPAARAFPRRRGHGGLRHLHGAGRGDLAAERQGAGASHRLRRRLRAAGESRHRGRADRKLGAVRLLGADVGRDQHPERARAADQLPRLPGRAHQRCAADRYLRHRQQRGARRHRRAGDCTGGAGGL